MQVQEATREGGPGGRCRSGEASVGGAAKVLYGAYVKEGRLGPIDKLANASNAQNLLVALYEVLRGLDEGQRAALSYLARAMEEDLARPDCVEEALKLGKRLAVRALSWREEGGKEGEEAEKGEEGGGP